MHDTTDDTAEQWNSISERVLAYIDESGGREYHRIAVENMENSRAFGPRDVAEEAMIPWALHRADDIAAEFVDACDESVPVKVAEYRAELLAEL